MTHFSHALETYMQLGDHTGVIRALNRPGLANQQSGHLSVSRSNFLEAQQRAKSLDNLMPDTTVLNNLGAIYAAHLSLNHKSVAARATTGTALPAGVGA